MDVECVGGVQRATEQHTSTLVSWVDRPAKGQYIPWRSPTMLMTYGRFLDCCGCLCQWEHDLRQRFGFLCSPPFIGGVVFLEEILPEPRSKPKPQPAFKATSGTLGQSTGAGCTGQTTTAEALPTRTSTQTKHGLHGVYASQCGLCESDLQHTLNQLWDLPCPPKTECDQLFETSTHADEQEPAGWTKRRSSAAPTPQPEPIQQQALSVGCLPEEQLTGSVLLTKGRSDV